MTSILERFAINMRPTPVAPQSPAPMPVRPAPMLTALTGEQRAAVDAAIRTANEAHEQAMEYLRKIRHSSGDAKLQLLYDTPRELGKAAYDLALVVEGLEIVKRML